MILSDHNFRPDSLDDLLQGLERILFSDSWVSRYYSFEGCAFIILYWG
jgi:hypothetical protein